MAQHRPVAYVFFMLVPVLFCRPSISAQGEEDKPNKRETGTIEGVITFAGDVPKSKVRDNAGQQRDLLIVDRKSKGLEFVLVYLDFQKAKHDDANTSETNKAGGDSIVVDQVEHTFVPHLIGIQDGQKVTFKNSDAANHNVRAIAFEEKNQFNIFTGAGGEYGHQFVAGKKLRPVVLSCDIHPWMRAWIYVFNHPYFAVTDERGRFRINDVPLGEHQLIVMQPDVGYRKTMSLQLTQSKAKPIEVKVKQADLKIR